MTDILDNAPCGFLTFGNDGLVQAVNATLLALIGREREEVVGRHFHSLLTNGGRIFYQTHLFPLLKMRGEVEEIYLSMLSKHGEEVPMLLNARQHARDGVVMNDCVCVRVRQRLHFENQLLKEKTKASLANQAKDAFLAALSHELRTPLNPMLMLSTEMELDVTLPPIVRQHARVIRSNAELEARLIDDLLDLTRIVNGKLNLVHSVVSVHELLTLTEDIVRTESAAKGVTLHFVKQAAAHHVLCDSARMQQVFWNLLKNAVKFTPTDGEVTIVTHNPAPDRIRVEVRDTGIGIEEAMLPQIFEAFDQGTINPHQFGGLGLGLAITRSIVELHAGTIQAQSGGQGKGATFTVEFAVCPPPDVAEQPLPPVITTDVLSILLVEDHDSTREVLARILRRSNHEVHTARDGAEALHLAATVPGVNLVISDIGLPDQSGFDLMRELKTRHRLPGIALSGYGMEADLKNARAAGFAAHLVKPVSLDQLRVLLNQAATGKLV